jgi:hypothetical protein
VDQRTDAGNDEDHHRRQLVEAEAEIDLQVARFDPGVDHLRRQRSARVWRDADQLPDAQHRDDERAEHHDRGEAAGHRLGQSAPHRRVDDEAKERKERDER